MKSLKGCVAVVAGASRGAGKGIALALGEAGATVYVAGRTSRRSRKKRADGLPGSVEDTADEVTAKGGTGIAVPTDCRDEAAVAKLFKRVENEQGKLDVLANAVYGAGDTFSSVEEWTALMGKGFWELDASEWLHTMDGGPRAYFLTSRHAAQMMVKAGKGLIVGVTDFVYANATEEILTAESMGKYAGSTGMLLADLSHVCINRLMRGMSVELKKHKVAVITLMPGFMQTETVMKFMTSEELKKQFRFDLSESTQYIGRAVAALAADKKAIKKTGRIHFVGNLAKEYGFTDIDGRYHPPFNPAG